MRTVILASQSNARTEIFSSLGIPFKIMPANIDELAIRDRNLKIRAEKLARTKAEKIALNNDAVIIAADTFDLIDGKVFEKPNEKKEAIKMLNALSESKAIAYTGFCYIDRKKNIDFSTAVSISYSFRKLYKNE